MDQPKLNPPEPSAKPKEFDPPRSHKRYPAYTDLSVMYEGHGGNVPVRAPDLSPTGMFINTPQNFPQGSVLKVKFYLPRTQKWVEARGEVRHVVVNLGVGIEFFEISDDDRNAIIRELEAFEQNNQ